MDFREFHPPNDDGKLVFGVFHFNEGDGPLDMRIDVPQLPKDLPC